MLLMYIDDIIVTRDDLSEMNRLKKSFSLKFEIKDLKFLRYFLRIEVAQSNRGMVVSQQKYVMISLKKLE